MTTPRTVLPVPAMPSDSVEIDGQVVHFHALSRSDAMKVSSFKGKEDAGEDFILARGTDLSIDEAHQWRSKVDLATAGLLIDAIIILSGLSNPAEAGKSPNA